MSLTYWRPCRLLMLCAVALSAVPNFLFAADKLKEQIEAQLALPHFKHAHWGLLFVDLDSGEKLYEQNADKLFAPASTTKLYSVAAALATFGADHKFQTPVHRRGKVDDAGVLAGDLILVASGDPTLGGRTNEKGEIVFADSDHTYANWAPEAELTTPDPLAGLNDLARQVVASGIRRVRGEVLIDDRLFEKSEGSGSGPGRLTPIMVNDNVLDFTIAPTAPGQLAKVTWRPETAAYRVDVKLETVGTAGVTETWIHDLGQGRLRITGTIPAGKKPIIRIYEVASAASFARSLFIEALGRAGVSVDASVLGDHPEGSLPDKEDYAALPVIAKFESPPFSENARLILKVSHNLHASTLPLLLAAQGGKHTLAAGLRMQHDFLAKSGIDVETISFGGGAGGSRADYVTPRATVQLLERMTTHKDYSVYRRALPILGVDGTLAKSVGPDSPARDKVFAKTGTLTWDNVMNGRPLLTSKALAGYMTTAQGRNLAFAMFVNNVHLQGDLNAARIGRDLGKLCEIVYQEAPAAKVAAPKPSKTSEVLSILTQGGRSKGEFGSLRNGPYARGPMRSFPTTLRSGSGTMIEPSACW